MRAVVFDIGETVLDDSREFGAWADWIGVPRHTFSAVLRAVTAEGRNNAETFQYFRPGFDLAAERQRREDSGVGEQYGEQDLYPDVRPALSRLREMGSGRHRRQSDCPGRADPPQPEPARRRGGHLPGA